MFDPVALLRRCLAPACLLCDLDPGDPVCAGCLADYFPPGVPRCPVCANCLPPGAGALPCGQCLSRPPAFDATLALADYAPPVDGLVAALKFRARLDIGRALGRLLAARWPGPGLPAAPPLAWRIVPLPLGARRLRERGFNPAEEIARGAARALRLPLDRATLVRVRETPAQHRLPLSQRRINVRGAFRAGPLPAGTGVLLVDDVLTSGSTLDAAAGALKAAGAVRVFNLVAARTP